MNRRLLVAVVSLTVILAGCGFHLRGDLSLPSALQRVYIDYHGSDVSVPQEIASTLVFNGSRVVRDQSEATATISILDSSYRSDVTARDKRGYPLEYLVTSNLSYRVTDANSRELLPEHDLKRERSLSLDSTDPLGSNSVLKDQRRIMRTDMIQQMMRQLSSIPDTSPDGIAP